MARRNVPGTTYLLHLDPPLRHARHYLGFAEADDLDSRLADHGGPHGARLLAAQKAGGGTWHLVRTWPGTTRAFERQIKNTRHVPHYCPECQPRRSADRRAARSAQAQPQDRKDSTMTTTSPDYQGAAQEQLEQKAAARLGFTDASRIVAAQYTAGMDLDAIAAHHDNVSADLLSDAQTPFGRAYGREYSDVAATLVADLRQDEEIAQGRSAAACAQPEGTPHPDSRLAGRGWQVDHGIYQRTGAGNSAPVADREAC